MWEIKAVSTVKASFIIRKKDRGGTMVGGLICLMSPSTFLLRLGIYVISGVPKVVIEDGFDVVRFAMRGRASLINRSYERFCCSHQLF